MLRGTRLSLCPELLMLRSSSPAMAPIRCSPTAPLLCRVTLSAAIQTAPVPSVALLFRQVFCMNLAAPFICQFFTKPLLEALP